MQRYSIATCIVDGIGRTEALDLIARTGFEWVELGADAGHLLSLIHI